MKFRTQHRDFTVIRGKSTERYRAHRDGTSVWATSGEKNTVSFHREMPTVRKAKNWMLYPSLS